MPEHGPCPVAEGTLPDRSRELLTRFDLEDEGRVFRDSGDCRWYARHLAGLLEEWLAWSGQRTR